MKKSVKNKRNFAAIRLEEAMQLIPIMHLTPGSYFAVEQKQETV